MTEFFGEALSQGRRILSDLAIPFDRLQPLKGGGRNVVLSVDGRLVLRLARDVPVGSLLAEAEILRQLGAHTRFPTVLQAGVKDGWTYQLQRFVSGVSPIHLWSRLTEAQKRVLIARLSEDLRIMHACGRDGFGCHGEAPRIVTWRDYCAQDLADLITRAEARHVLPDFTRDSRLFFDAHGVVLGEGRRGCLVHNDLWFGNMLVDQGELTAVLDFELAFWGEPDTDLFKFEFFCRRPEDYGCEGDFADAMPLMAEFYPDLFVPDVARRLDLYDLIFTWRQLLYGLDRGGQEAPSYVAFARRHLARLLGGRIQRLV